MTTPSERGALYVAFGDLSRTAATRSILTLRKFSPGLPVAVVSTTPFPGADISIVRPEMDPGARVYKTGMYDLSPFAETLFLDADTEVRASPQAGFNLLGYVDLVLGQDRHRVFSTNHYRDLIPEEVAYTKKVLGTGEVMYYNSGVIFFRRGPRVERLFKAWAGEWNEFGSQDQMALIRAIARNPVTIAPMRAPWNTNETALVKFVYHKHSGARREGAPL